jgi:hypothetical protein
MTQELKPLSLESVKTIAPAVFATEPASHINLKRYNFVPTTDIIEKMETNGWVLTDAKQSRSKSDLRNLHGVHMVKFQHPDLYINDGDGGIEGRPQMVFLNSHDGTRPLQVELGIFRLVCSNGLMIKSHDMGGFRERHTKLTNDGVKLLLDEKLQLADQAVDRINRWSGIQMRNIDMRKFATDALLMRLGEDRQPEEHEIRGILEAHRDSDNKNTLWHVFNRVQENIIKGGFNIGERKARAITNPIADMVLNQGLWQLAEEYAVA